MTFFSDPTDFLAGSTYRQKDSKEPSGIVLHFKHVATGVTAEFKAFIEEFDDAFASSWNNQEVWGRMDEIQTFKNTKRVISISWTVPSHSEEEAISNFGEISKMTAMLYPVYEDLSSDPDFNSNKEDYIKSLEDQKQNLLDSNLDQNQLALQQGILDKKLQDVLNPVTDTKKNPKIRENVTLLSSPPIIQMTFKNWVSNNDGSGLYGTLAGFNFNPDLESGVFIRDNDLIPMSFKCSVQFTVMHTDRLGWNSGPQKTLRSGVKNYFPTTKIVKE